MDMETAPARYDAGLIEIRLHARAGQGAKAAAQILAEASLKAGLNIQAFPQYGPERRGAPVTAFVRLSSIPIDLHSEITSPTHVVVLEATLLNNPEVFEGIVKESILLINTPFLSKNNQLKSCPAKIYSLGGSKISQHFLGANLPNVAMLGGLIKILGIPNLADLKSVLTESMAQHWGAEVAEKNYLAAKVGFSEVKEVVG